MAGSKGPDWEKLAAEQETWQAAGNPGRTGPFFREQARGDLQEWARRFSAGDRRALFAAIRICAVHELPLPDWAAEAFISGYDDVLNCRVGSWDEAFGKPWPGKHLPELAQRRRLQFAIPLRIRDLRLQANPPPMNSSRNRVGVYDLVAEEFGVSRTFVADRWKEWKQQEAALRAALDTPE